MEFPDLGKNCSVSSCNQLDFLPMICDSCNSIFCKTHYLYDSHQCPNAYMKNVQVPVCPLCNQPVPTKRGEAPDIGVSQHIDRDCQSDRAQQKRNAVYNNKCSLKGCKQKELVPLICADCNLNYCLKHRHSADHKCQPMDNQVKNKAGAAAMLRLNKNKNVMKERNMNQAENKPQNKPQQHASHSLGHRSDAKSIQGNLSEDEALARALQQSMIDTNRHQTNVNVRSNSNLTTQEREDEMLAQAIAESQREANKNKDKCSVS